MNFKVSNPPETMTKRRFTGMEIYATFVASFSFLCIGLLRSFTSPAITSMQKEPELFNSTSFTQQEIISWIASSPPMASFMGTVLSGPMLQYFGRKATIIFLSIPFIVGWISIGFAENVLMIMCGRLLTGLGAGIATAGAQLYVSECVRPEVRGTLGFLPSMMLALGVLVGFALSTINVEWRELALIMGSLPTALFIMSLTIPESPPWLIMNGNIEKAMKSMISFRGSSSADEQQEIQQEIEQLKEAIESDKSYTRVSMRDFIKTFWENIRKRGIWYPALIALGLMMFQQFAAANVVIYFLSVILTDAEPHNVSNYIVLDHNVGSVIVGAVQFLAFFFSLPLIDRMGRKLLLIISAILMALSLGILGMYFYAISRNIDNENNYLSVVSSTYRWLPVTCLSCFIASYSIGFGPVPFIIMSEIFPSKARSYLCSLTSFANHFFLFIVIKMFPMMIQWFGHYGTFWLFGLSCLISILLVIFAVPETKGKSLAEIEREFCSDKRQLVVNVISD